MTALPSTIKTTEDAQRFFDFMDEMMDRECPGMREHLATLRAMEEKMRPVAPLVITVIERYDPKTGRTINKKIQLPTLSPSCR